MEEENKELEVIMKAFNELLDTGNDQSLKAIWWDLQRYANWCIRLPDSEAELKSVLGINDPGAYSFFELMLETYQELDGAGKYFMNEVFSDVTNLGDDLISFAEDASEDDGAIFLLIRDLLDPDNKDYNPKEALSVIKDLQDQSRENAGTAEALEKKLAKFDTKLGGIISKLEVLSTNIEEDSKTSQATIDKLSGGEDVEGSILELTAELDDWKEKRKKAVTVAATSPTYAWIGFPPLCIGLAVAAVVAGTYGDIAIRALKKINKLIADLRTAAEDLQIALKTRGVQRNAKDGVTRARENTRIARSQATSLKNSWHQIVRHLDKVANKMQALLNDEGEVQSASRIESYLKSATKAWDKLLPLLEELMDNVYVEVEPETKTVEEFTEEVQTIWGNAA